MGTERREPVEGLADHELRREVLQVPRREVVAGAVTGYVIERVGLRHVAALASEDDDQLDLVVELFRRRGRQRNRATVMVERVVELVEKGRIGGDGRAGFGGMPPVVEPHHDDLLRTRDERRMLHGTLLEIESGRTISCRRHQRRQHRALAVLQQVVGVHRRRQPVLRGGRCHIEDPLPQLHAEPGPGGSPHVQQRHVSRHLERARSCQSGLRRHGSCRCERGGSGRDHPAGGGLQERAAI